MEEWIGELWREYHREVIKLYETPSEWMLGDGLTKESLSEVVRLADQIDGACSAVMGDGDDEEAPTALIASAAVDANVAADVLVATFDDGGDVDQGLYEEALALVGSEGPPPGSERSSLRELLLAGDEAFLGEAMEGAAPPVDARERAQQTIEELLKRATPAAGGFAVGTVTFGGGELIALLGHVEVLKQVAETAQSLFYKGLALLRRAIRKLMKALGGLASFAEVGGTFAAGELVNALHEQIGRLELRAVRKITRADQAEGELDRLEPRLARMDAGRLRSLSSQLDEMCSSYRKRMKCAGVMRTALRLAGPPVAGATGGTGVPVVAGLNATGLIYVLYSLAARLGTAPAPITRGVPTLAREALEARN